MAEKWERHSWVDELMDELIPGTGTFIAAACCVYMVIQFIKWAWAH